MDDNDTDNNGGVKRVADVVSDCDGVDGGGEVVLKSGGVLEIVDEKNNACDGGVKRAADVESVRDGVDGGGEVVLKSSGDLDIMDEKNNAGICDNNGCEGDVKGAMDVESTGGSELVSNAAAVLDIMDVDNNVINCDTDTSNCDNNASNCDNNASNCGINASNCDNNGSICDNNACEGGVKRAMDVDSGDGGEGGNGEAVKRRKKDKDEMKRVAEIVLVLAAMGKMRGGRDPTVVEMTLMAEARAKVAAMCEDFAPKDIVPIEACPRVIEDLGLNRLKDHLAFRTPKHSISEKIAFNKRRMEESKAFASQSASFPSQRVPTANGSVNENLRTPPNFRVLSSDKSSHLPGATGTFQPPTSSVNVSSIATPPMQFRPPGTEVRPSVVSPAVQNNIGRNASSVVAPKPDRAHIKSDGRPNGPSVPNVSAGSGAHPHTRRTAPAHLQPQPHPQVNIGTKSMVPNQSSVRIDRNVGSTAPQIISQPIAQMSGHAVNQTARGAQPPMHHPVQNMQFVHAPQAVNHHLEISKLVQRLLVPKLPSRPVGSSPSKDYMNRAILCQFCKLVINEVENMVVCDACEKGFHLGCLQSYNAKGLPRGEWHCPRCMAMSHGKPFPPKYGRVTRNMNVPKASSSAIGAQLSEKKVGIVDTASLPNSTTNRNQDSKPQPRVNQPNLTRNDISAGVKEHKPKLEKCTSNLTGATTETSLLTSTPISANDKSSQEVKSEKPSSEDSLMSETEPRTSVISQANSKPDNLSTSSSQKNVERKVLGSVENSVLEYRDSNGIAGSHVGSDEGKHAVQKNLVAIGRVRDQVEDLAEASQSGMHNVDWISEIDQIVDGKKFFRSCCINGMVYQVQDYALFRSGNGKLMPLKLQAMWEDIQTTSKWLVVHKCYFPDDLPKEVGRPGAPESNEVYESTHDSNVLAGFIEGPCEVLPFRKFGDATETSDQGSHAKERSQPVFIRNWFYDDTRRAFCPSAS